MHVSSKQLAVLSILPTLLLSVASAAYATIIVDVLHPSEYNSVESDMNDNLGITPEYLIEDFEDTNLVTGLMIDVEDNSGFNVVFPLGDLFWDGQKVLENTSDSGLDGKDVTFTFAPGVTGFGIGLSILDNPTYPHQVIVNGGTVFTTEIFQDSDWVEPVTPGEFIRNGYVWFTATGGDSISSIKFQTSEPSGDTIYFDHAAILVPEPSTGLLVGLGLTGVALRRRRG